MAEARPMVGLFALLTPEQQRKLVARPPNPFNDFNLGPERLDKPAPGRVQNMEIRTSKVPAQTPHQLFKSLATENALRVDYVRRGRHHRVDVFAPSGQRFSGSCCPSRNVWESDEDPPDWGLIHADIFDVLPLEEDPDHEE